MKICLDSTPVLIPQRKKRDRKGRKIQMTSFVLKCFQIRMPRRLSVVEIDRYLGTLPNYYHQVNEGRRAHAMGQAN